MRTSFLEFGLDFKVWAEDHTEFPDKDGLSFTVTAAFLYLQEALDYVRYCVQMDAHVVLTGPNGLAVDADKNKLYFT